MGHLLIAYGRYCHELRTNTIAEDHDAASYQLTYGGWIKTLRRAGLVIDDLIEPGQNSECATVTWKPTHRLDVPLASGNALDHPQAVNGRRTEP